MTTTQHVVWKPTEPAQEYLMDDENRIDDLDAEDQSERPSADQDSEGEGVPIPSKIRDAVEDVGRRIRDEAARGRDVVKEYEERYRETGRSRLETPPQEEAVPPSGVYVPYKPKRWHDPASVSENERKWAALAHASTLLTALVALGSGGLGVLITMFVPLFIYFSFRKRSEYVAFHALQAFTIQLVGTIGWLALLVVGTVVAIALFFVSLILIVLLVGIILVPVVVLAYVLFVLASLLLPIGMVIYSVIAAVETWSGHNYRYPYIARWVESQMHGSLFTIL
jgi:uncharacterized Tic20 family protein